VSKSFFEATRCCVLLDERLLSFFFALLLPPPILIRERERDEKERHEQLRIVSFFSRVLSSVLFMEKTPHYKDTQNARRETMMSARRL
jgi:hypothetical protein